LYLSLDMAYLAQVAVERQLYWGVWSDDYR